MLAQKQKLAVSANNIANVSTVGKIPDPTATESASTVYKPLKISFSPSVIENLGSGVRSEVVEDSNAYSISYAPSSPFADEEGLIAVPNVDLVEESVNLITAKLAYKANIAAFKTADEMTRELLDTLA